MTVSRRPIIAGVIHYLAAVFVLTSVALIPRVALAADIPLPQLEAAAEKGFVPQEVELAAAYFIGAGVQQDTKLAAYWYEKAAKSGDPEAENEIAYLYQTGQGVPADSARAFHWYQLAAASGYVKAKVNLGVLYVWGIGVQKNESLAADLFRQAVEKGNGAAAGYLGDMYCFGLGMKQDKSVAEKWYTTGARLHDPVSAFNLGSLYSVRQDHIRDLPKATLLLRESASGGYVPAMHSLGLLLTNHPELVGAHDDPRGMLRDASIAGYWRSSVVMGILARDGKDTAVDPDMAYYFFKLAVLQGGESTARLLANDLNALAPKLSKDEMDALSAKADTAFKEHPLALAFVYKQGENSRRFPAFARTVADDGVHAGQLVIRPPV